VNAPAPIRVQRKPGDPALAARLRRAIQGEVLFDAASRGRYATDASIYQIEPLGVVVPRSEDDVAAALEIAREAGVPVLPRGAGTSQCGQTVGAALVIDTSKFLREVVRVDADARLAEVQPGVVLDQLNAQLKPLGLLFPVDVSTSAQATLGGRAGNNSCGACSIRHGNMVHNVAAIDAWLADGTSERFGPPEEMAAGGGAARALVARIHAIAAREAAEIAARWPTVLRRVQGYNLDMVQPHRPHNLAHLLVGSEGTLAWFRRLELKLSPLPRHKVLGVCRFARFFDAMDLTRHIVTLDPDAVELVDRTMIGLALDHEEFRPVVERWFSGGPDAILLVEFAGEDKAALEARLARLSELLADNGAPDAVLPVTDAAQQRALWEVRKAGLNIMMSMKGDGKPVSFIEDCAVPLEHLAEYTRRLDEVFARHGTRGTWYAHASVGTLHVRPVLDMKTDGAAKMRAIAEEACALVREYKGAAFSGEHGDGLVRSEWIEPILGPRLVAALGEIKALLDPDNRFNPGKIVAPTRMDDRRLFRAGPHYRPAEPSTALDWSEWGGVLRAVEMCNNNGHCRKFDAGTLCPSFRVTRDERHLTRGRANTLRLALSGQLAGEDMGGEAVREALDLCVGCKGCRRECPTGVDMARLKIEALHQRHRHVPRSPRQRLVARLPDIAPLAAALAPLSNVREWLPGVAMLAERVLGLSAKRALPRWRRDAFRDAEGDALHATGAATAGARDSSAAPREVVLFGDTFNRWFEPDNLRAALAVLRAGGWAWLRPPMAAGRCAAGGPCLPAARWTRPAPRRAGHSRRCRRTWRRAGAWWCWSPLACTPSTTSSWRCSRAPRRTRWPRRSPASRISWCPSTPRAACRWSWRRWRPRWRWCPACGAAAWSRAAAACRVRSATRPSTAWCRSPWPRPRCCPPCAPRPMRWWWPTARAVATRCAPAPGARRCTWPGCWRRPCARAADGAVRCAGAGPGGAQSASREEPLAVSHAAVRDPRGAEPRPCGVGCARTAAGARVRPRLRAARLRRLLCPGRGGDGHLRSHGRERHRVRRPVSASAAVRGAGEHLGADAGDAGFVRLRIGSAAILASWTRRVPCCGSASRQCARRAATLALPPPFGVRAWPILLAATGSSTACAW
jgi:FAD/FMN-containing dehydrogenase/NAD-dependent dihydropyrimidine dehydrogenase PreA subunit